MRAFAILMAIAAFALGAVLVANLTGTPPVGPEGATATPVAQPVGATSDRSETRRELRIGILEFSRIHQQAQAIQSIDEAYRKAIQIYAEDAKARENELRAAEDELRKKEGEVSPEDFQRERAQLQRRMARAMELVQERKRTLDLARQEGLNQVQTALNEVVFEIADEMGLSLILRKEQTVLVAVDFEITDEVLRRLNSRLPSVDVLAPEN